MSESEKVLNEETLRLLVERVPGYRLEAAKQLLVATSNPTSLRAVIKHVPQLREEAAKQLLLIPDLVPSDYDEILELVSSPSLRQQAGEKILNWEPRYYEDFDKHPRRYVKLGLEIESLRDLAISKLCEKGVRTIVEINFVWRYGTTDHKELGWQRFRDHNWLADRRVFARLILEGAEDDLSERAWKSLAFQQSNDYVLLPVIGDLLASLGFAERAWARMLQIKFEDHRLLGELYPKYPAFQERILQEMFRIIATVKGRREAYKSLMAKGMPAGIIEWAKDRLFEDSPDESALSFLTLFPSHCDRAAQMLLSGNYM